LQILTTMLILASSSPRRREILETIGAKFHVATSQIDESVLPNEAPENYVVRLAREKARDVIRQFSTGFVIGADTTVVLNNQILGKPKDEADARSMLKQLADNWHEVMTGIAVIDASTSKEVFDLCRTRVRFTAMSDEEIEWYLRSGEPFDKAGAYAIQGLGSLFIEEIEGNYLNVVGLPITLLRRLVESVGGRLL
jgi:septum formation protein